MSLPGHDVHLCYDVVGQQTIGVSGYQHDRILPAALAGLGKDNIDDSSVLYACEPLRCSRPLLIGPWQHRLSRNHNVTWSHTPVLLR